MRFLLFLSFLFLFSVTNAQTWEQKDSVPFSGRYNSVAFSIGGLGYLCGGSTSLSNPLNELWQYDPLSDSWTAKSNIPGTARDGHIAFVIDTVSFVGLGYDPSGNSSLKDFYKYNPNTDTWTQLANFPGASYRNSASSSLNGRGYVIGGGFNRGNTSSSKEVWEYYPGSDSWVQRPNHPFAQRVGGVSFSGNGLVFYGFGHNYTQNFNDLWAFNPSTNSWTQKASFPGLARFKPFVFSINDKFIIGGGKSLGGAILTDYYIYDPALDTWSSTNSIPSFRRSNSSFTSINSEGYLFGGIDSLGSNVNEVWKTYDSTLSVSIENNSSLSSFKLYPNPTSSRVEIISANNGIVNFLDINGRLVKNEVAIKSNQVLKIELVDLEKGVYLIQLRTKKGIISKKILLQ